MSNTSYEKKDLSKIKLTIKEIQEENRPREILMNKGASFLSDEQLLAILMQTGTKELSVVELSQKLIEHFDGLDNLLNTDLKSLMSIKGIGLSKASKIMATFELAKRASLLRSKKNEKAVESPQDLIDVFFHEFDMEKVEIFKCIMLNTKNRIIGSENITKGLVNATLISPREIYQKALSKSASAIIVMHNHPSKDPNPSKEDIEITKKIYKAGKVLDIPLIDHIIYGSKNSYYSFIKEGMLYD